MSSSAQELTFGGKTAFEYATMLCKITKGMSISTLLKVARGCGFPVNRTSKGVLINTIAKLLVIAKPAKAVEFFGMLAASYTMQLPLAHAQTTGSFFEEFEMTHETLENELIISRLAIISLIALVVMVFGYASFAIVRSCFYAWKYRKSRFDPVTGKGNKLPAFRRVVKITVSEMSEDYIFKFDDHTRALISGDLFEKWSSMEKVKIATDKKPEVILESMKIGSEMNPHKGPWPDGLVEMCIKTKKGDIECLIHQAWGVRIDDFLFCSSHQLVHGEKLMLASDSRIVEFDLEKAKELVAYNDVTVLEVEPKIWSMLSTKAAQVCQAPKPTSSWSNNLVVQLFGRNSKDKNSTICYTNGVAHTRTFSVEHEASTIEGWSGTPIYFNRKVLGIHTQGSKTESNAGTLAYGLYLLAKSAKGKKNESEFNWKDLEEKGQEVDYFRNQSSGDFLVYMDGKQFIVEEEEWSDFVAHAKKFSWKNKGVELERFLTHKQDWDEFEPDETGAKEAVLIEEEERLVRKQEKLETKKIGKMEKVEPLETEAKQTKTEKIRKVEPLEAEVKQQKQEIIQNTKIPESSFRPAAVAALDTETMKRLDQFEAMMQTLMKKTEDDQKREQKRLESKLKRKEKKKKEKQPTRKPEATVVNGEIVDDAPESNLNSQKGVLPAQKQSGRSSEDSLKQSLQVTSPLLAKTKESTLVKQNMSSTSDSISQSQLDSLSPEQTQQLKLILSSFTTNVSTQKGSSPTMVNERKS